MIGKDIKKKMIRHKNHYYTDTIDYDDKDGKLYEGTILILQLEIQIEG